MTMISKFAGVLSCGFVLCIGLPSGYAAHPQAEKDMSDDRGSQGNQELIKGDSTPKKGQDEKVDETQLKENKKAAKQEFDKNNSKGQEEMSHKSKAPLRKLQNN